MAVIVHNCPHCPARNSTFTIAWQSQIFGKDVGPFSKWVTAQCGACLNFVLCDLLFTRHPTLMSTDMVAQSGNIERLACVLIKMFPERAAAVAPEHVPATIAAAFLDGVETFAIGKWNPAGISFRRALDIATRSLVEDAKIKDYNLFGRIDYLFEQGRITSGLQEWAHAIRDDGNGAAHDDEPLTEGKAERLWRFTEMFLVYVYTMPGELAARRAELDIKT